MTTRLRDIAAKLNLSPGLISGVLNNRPGVWASEATRQRIRLTAQELEYRPNSAARALGSGKANAVAFVYSIPEDPHLQSQYSSIAGVLGRRLNAIGCELLLRVLDNQQAFDDCLAELVRSRATDAFVLWGSEADVEQQAHKLQELRVPFLVKGRHEQQHPSWPQIDYDHEAMMQRAVAHLADRGHERIAYIGHITDQPFRFCLREGFQEAMRARFGQPAPPEYIAELHYPDNYARQQMLAWLALPALQRPTALVIGAGNTTWNGVEMALALHDQAIGDGKGEFSVAGITHPPHNLLFGEGHSYPHVDFIELTEAALLHLLLPILRGEEIANPILRICPELRPIPTLHMLDYTIFRVESEAVTAPK